MFSLLHAVSDQIVSSPVFSVRGLAPVFRVTGVILLMRSLSTLVLLQSSETFQNPYNHYITQNTSQLIEPPPPEFWLCHRLRDCYQTI